MGAADTSLHHNYVSHGDTPGGETANIIIAATGPFFSLVVALKCHVFCKMYKSRDLKFLALLYMSVFAYISFLGYFAIAPFFPMGDTGYIYASLGVPLPFGLGVSAISIAAIVYVLNKLSNFFAEMGSEEVFASPESRLQFANSFIKYPLFIGIIVTVLLNLPAQVYLSLLYPAFSPMAIMFCFGNLLRKDFQISNSNSGFDALQKNSPLLIASLLAVVIINRLLVFGIYL